MTEIPAPRERTQAADDDQVPLREIRVNPGDVLVMPDGERWHVTKDSSSHLFWLANDRGMVSVEVLCR